MKFYWHNPPRADTGGTIERFFQGRAYSREVGPHGLLTPREAASALEVRREFVYNLVLRGKLKSVKRKGRMLIPLSAVRAYKDRRRRRAR